MQNPGKRNEGGDCTGFTLVEIMAALVVSVLVLALVLTIRQAAVATQQAVQIQGHLQQTVRNAETVLLGFIRDSQDVYCGEGNAIGECTAESRQLTAVQPSGDTLTAQWNGGDTLTVTIVKATAGTVSYTFQPITGLQIAQESGASSRVIIVTLTASQGKLRFTDTISVAPRIPPRPASS